MQMTSRSSGVIPTALVESRLECDEGFEDRRVVGEAAGNVPGPALFAVQAVQDLLRARIQIAFVRGPNSRHLNLRNVQSVLSKDRRSSGAGFQQQKSMNRYDPSKRAAADLSSNRARAPARSCNRE